MGCFDGLAGIFWTCGRAGVDFFLGERIGDREGGFGAYFLPIDDEWEMLEPNTTRFGELYFSYSR